MFYLKVASHSRRADKHENNIARLFYLTSGSAFDPFLSIGDDMSDSGEKQIPKMADLELEDVVSVLMGVPPEGKEVVIYEAGEDDNFENTVTD